MTPEQKQQLEQIQAQQSRHSALFDASDSHKIVQRSEIRTMLNSIDFLLSLVKSQQVRESVPCACHTFDLDPVIRAYLSDKFIHTTVACPALPLGNDQNCLICHHDRKFYNAEADACEHVTGLTKIEIFCGCACRFPIPDAAVSMRSRCVEKVKALRDEAESLISRATRHSNTRRRASITFQAYEKAVTALESVSIQEQEK